MDFLALKFHRVLEVASESRPLIVFRQEDVSDDVTSSSSSSSLLPEPSVYAGFILVAFLSVVGVLLNVLALFALLSCQTLKQQSTTQFVVSLAVSDLIYSALTLPTTALILAECGFCRNDILCR
jgi:hypothetical protein